MAAGLMALQPEASTACIVTHPHPGRGGDKYNAFVGEAVRACRFAGVSTLRFNFSCPGEYCEDMEGLLATNVTELSAAISMFSHAAPQSAIVLVGYSWGSLVSLAAARKAPSAVQVCVDCHPTHEVHLCVVPSHS